MEMVSQHTVWKFVLQDFECLTVMAMKFVFCPEMWRHVYRFSEELFASIFSEKGEGESGKKVDIGEGKLCSRLRGNLLYLPRCPCFEGLAQGPSSGCPLPFIRTTFFQPEVRGRKFFRNVGEYLLYRMTSHSEESNHLSSLSSLHYSEVSTQPSCSTKLYLPVGPTWRQECSTLLLRSCKKK
jgi:hypothetical protein